MSRRERIKQLRRRILLLVLSVVFTLSLCIVIFAFRSNAQDDTPMLHKYYRSVSVSYGDTLSTYEARYNDTSKCSSEAYIAEIRRINHMGEDDVIYSGTKIIVPYYSYDIVF